MSRHQMKTLLESMDRCASGQEELDEDEIDPSLELDAGEEELTERKKKKTKSKKKASKSKFVGVPYGFGRDDLSLDHDALSESLQAQFEDFLSSENSNDDGLEQDRYAIWQRKVQDANPGKKIKFLSKPDAQGTICAEVPGEDRCYGVFNMEKEEGELLSETDVQESDEYKPVLRLVKVFKSEDGSKVAKVYRDQDWDEFRVRFWVDGVHQKKADHHSDKEDAYATAEHWTNKAVSEDASETVDPFAPATGQQALKVATPAGNQQGVTNTAQNTAQPAVNVTPQMKAQQVADDLKAVMNDPSAAGAFKQLLAKLPK